MGDPIRPYIRKLNPKAGQSPIFTFDFPDGFVLLVDTREQDDPLFLIRPPKGLILTRTTLKTGDYSVKGFEQDGIIIERKKVGDLFSSLTRERKEFKERLQKMSRYEYRCLVIEAEEEEVLSWQLWSKIHPNSIRQNLVSLEIRFGVVVHYQPNREKLERWVLDRLIKFYRVKRGN